MLLVTEKYLNEISFLRDMTSTEEHRKNITQFLDDISEKIRSGLLVDRQKIIAFSSSEAATNLVEYFLHKKNVVSMGFHLNHNYFASEQRAERMLEFDFPKKKELVSLLVKQEELRNLLCYGKEKKGDKVEEAIATVQKIREIVARELGEKL